MQAASPNKLFLWRDASLYLGDSFDPQMHKHHAVQCCIALNGHLKVRWQQSQSGQSCSAAIVGANIPHSIANPDGPLCILYLEKTSNNFQTILDYHCITPNCQTRSAPLMLEHPVPESSLRIFNDALTDSVTASQANILKHHCLKIFNGHIARPTTLDSRITKLLAYLHADPGGQFNSADLIEVACLSESRMQHLFKQQVGIPIRRYVLWMRMRHVLELVLAGASLTVAAYESGFSDSAHYSRTFKSMFGIAPSILLASNSALKPMICEPN